jgi:hypothetical protein
MAAGKYRKNRLFLRNAVTTEPAKALSFRALGASDHFALISHGLADRAVAPNLLVQHL